MQRTYTKQNISPDSLLGCRFFDRLSQEERADVARHCEGRRYCSGAEIVRHRDRRRDVFFILSGRVQASMLTKSGKVVTFQELAHGEMFGELSAIDEGPRSASVVTVVDSTLIRISGTGFKDLIARYPLLAEQTLLRVCGLARFLCERAFEARAFTVPDQIGIEIYRIVSAHPCVDNVIEINPSPTHADIATRVGTTREQVTRVMGDLARKDLIRQSRKAWQIPDVDALLRAIGHPIRD